MFGGIFRAVPASGPSGGGQLEVTTNPPANFNGGAPASPTGEIYVSEEAPQVFVGGIGYMNDGRICITYDNVPIASSARGGIPMSADGRVVCNAGQPVTSHLHGLPLATGKIALEAQDGGEVDLNGYDSGYDDGYGA